jgi:hypothetical protein
MSNDLANFGDNALASVTRGAGSAEPIGISGRYDVTCYDKDGNIKWQDYADNIVTIAGKTDLFNYYFGATGTGGGTASGVNFLGLVGYTGTSVTAGSFVIGSTYIITSVGTTTFTAIGASANTVGVVFIATGVGSGSGTANLIGTFSSADTMTTHAGWLEVGLANAPTYTGNRQSVSWTAVTSSGAFPAVNTVSKSGTAVVFVISSTGTVGGCFICSGSGASATKDTTTGTLYSAGAFSAGQKAVTSGDSLSVTYTTSANS